MAIVRLLDAELYITYSWIPHASKIMHGICGHTFEMIEYYWILKDHIKTKLLWPESDINKDNLRIIIKNKYDFNDNEINNIIDNSVFEYNPKLLQCTNLLIVDGAINQKMKDITIFAKNVILFACGDKELCKIKKENYHILQDKRVYKEGPRTTNYVKKLLLSRYINLNFRDMKMNTLVYLTTNCRKIDINELEKIIIDYNERINNSRGWLIATNEIEYYKPLIKSIGIDTDRFFEVKELPIENFHLQFNNMLYTELERKWDCSNRLLVECKHYNKTFNMKLSEEYYKEDKALWFRKVDLADMDWKTKLELNNHDDIIDIVKNIIC